MSATTAHCVDCGQGLTELERCYCGASPGDLPFLDKIGRQVARDLTALRDFQARDHLDGLRLQTAYLKGIIAVLLLEGSDRAASMARLIEDVIQACFQPVKP